ncbi:protein kinase [Thermoproteota archaeon]
MKKIESFDFQPGEVILKKYEILDVLGKGWEAEVYLVKEIATGIERAAKFFYPHRNPREKASKFYAKKLHKLRSCSILIQYFGQETIYVEGEPVIFLVSEFIDGEQLSDFLKRQPGQRLSYFAALHFLHALAEGMEDIHRLKEYHGDLHSENILIERSGLKFQLKVLDLYQYGRASAEDVKDDVVDMIQIFYDVLGGRKHYSKLPKEIKDICCGLKKSLILQKFRTAGQLKNYIENLEWE